MIFGFFGRILFGGKKTTVEPPVERPKRPESSGGPDADDWDVRTWLNRNGKDEYEEQRLARIQQEDEEIMTIIISAMELIQ